MVETSLKEEGLWYIEQGLPIIPVCSSSHRGMSPTHSDKCKSPGKSPYIPDWQNKKVTTKEEFLKWYLDNKWINIGLPLGKASGLVGIDVDGAHGEELLAQMSQGDLPATWEFTTGAGRRLLYSIPVGVATKKFSVTGGKHEEVSILCDGQQTVLPPSLHALGVLYRWVHHPKDIPLAMTPDWVIEKITDTSADELWATPDTINLQPAGVTSPQVVEAEFDEDVGEGKRSNTMTRLVGSIIKRRDKTPEETLAFIRDWNNLHCKPPLPDAELIKMVKGISATEELKKARRKSEKPVGQDFNPRAFAKMFVNEQNTFGYNWKYSVEQARFYKCQNDVGPWSAQGEVYVDQVLRAIITDSSKGGSMKFSSMHYLNETRHALAETLADTVEEGIFDIGTMVDRQKDYSTLYGDDVSDGYNPYNIISVKNGVLHWKTKILKPWEPHVYTTIQLPVEYAPTATCTHWNQVLAEWIPDTGAIKFLQEYVGLCLIPDTSFRTAVFLYGSGANGKSLFLEAIQLIFGDALNMIPLHRLVERFEIVYLQNKLINICGDIDAKYMTETGTLKALIAGDKVRGEIKFGASYNYRPVVRLIFSANTLPHVSDKTSAWYSRWQFIEFPKTFAVNPGFTRKMKEEFHNERSGILNWALEGLDRLRVNGTFTTSATMKASANDYRMENDNVAAFVDSVVMQVEHTGAETTVATAVMHNLYRDWLDTHMSGSIAVGQIEFTKRVKALGIAKDIRPVSSSRRTACFLGVHISSEFRTLYDMYQRNFATGG